MKIQLKKLVDSFNEADYMDGITWYVDAFNETHRMADEYGVDFLKVCGMASALSPGVSWPVNLRDLESLIAHLVNGLPAPTVSTYGNNLSKACDIFNCDGRRQTIEKILIGVAGWKTHAFFLNISHLDTDAVTIDRHILRAINFKEKSLTRKRYEHIQTTFKRRAKEFNMVACDLQAAVWCNYKRLNNI